MIDLSAKLYEREKSIMLKSESTVWISGAYRSSSLLKPVRAYPDQKPMTPESKRFADITSRYMEGEPVSDDEIPRVFYGEYKDTWIKSLPDFFSCQTFLTLSERFADVLCNFGLEQDLRPVTLLQGDRETPIQGGPFYILVISARKRAFLPTHSNLKSFSNRTGPSGDYWSGRLSVDDEDTALSPDALEGADLWCDPLVTRVFFLSNRLLMALREAKVTRTLGHRRCRIIESEVA